MGVRKNEEEKITKNSSGLLLFLSLSLLGHGCAPAVPAKVPTVSLRMGGQPADALVVVDEESVGTLDFVAAHGVALPPGLHHVTVKATGFFPWDREVEARVGSPPIRLDVAMIPVPD